MCPNVENLFHSYTYSSNIYWIHTVYKVLVPMLCIYEIWFWELKGILLMWFFVLCKMNSPWNTFYNAHFSPELHPARPLRTPAWGLWAGWARAESAAGTRGRGWATGSERSFVPGCPASGGPVAQESPSGRSCGREEKLLYFQPMASVCSSLTAIACRGLCADISWGRVLVDANAQISREISEWHISGTSLRALG